MAAWSAQTLLACSDLDGNIFLCAIEQLKQYVQYKIKAKPKVLILESAFRTEAATSVVSQVYFFVV